MSCFLLSFRRLTLVAGFGVWAAVPASGSSDVELRAELERIYYEWRGAILNRDVRAWQMSTCRYRQVHTRNLMVSQRQPYPDAVFDVPLRPPDISRLRLLEVEAVGDTAHLLFFGKVDLGLEGEVVPDNLLMLRYLKDPEGWRFDSNRLINLENAPEIRASLKEGGRPDFLDEAQFNPPGNAPVVPAVCPVPDYVAGFYVQSFGYEVTMHINGFDYPPLSDIATNQLIIGGLRRDENDVAMEIRVLPVEEGEERLLAVDVMILPKEAGEEPNVISSFQTTDADPPPRRKMTVWVNQATLKR